MFSFRRPPRKGLVTRNQRASEKSGAAWFCSARLLPRRSRCSALPFTGRVSWAGRSKGRDFWKSVGSRWECFRPRSPRANTQAAPTGTVTRGDTAIVRYEAPNRVHLGDRSDIGLSDSVAPRAKLSELATQRLRAGQSPRCLPRRGCGWSRRRIQAGAAAGERGCSGEVGSHSAGRRPRQRLRGRQSLGFAGNRALAELLRLETLKLNLGASLRALANLIDPRALFLRARRQAPPPEDSVSGRTRSNPPYGPERPFLGQVSVASPASPGVGDVASVRSIGEGLQRFVSLGRACSRRRVRHMGKLSGCRVARSSAPSG